jgi:cytochrome b561
MIICAFENSPSIPSFLVTKIVYIGYGQLKKMTPFPFTFPQLCSLYFYILLLLMPVLGSVLLLYAGAHNISLKYLFPEKKVHRSMLSKMPEM